ncbi:MAG TPA: cyanophycin synthetase [Polyangiaceae bacterium]|nr:cyanophycin synthetase [Polyangiaceae bacterium]
MKLESKRLLRGPNRWSDLTLLEGIVKVDAADAHDACWARLTAEYPELCARVFAGAPAVKGSALFWAHVVGKLVVELQVLAKIDVAFMLVLPLDAANEARFVAEYLEEATAERALALAVELIDAARAGKVLDLPAEVTALRKLNEETRLGPSTGAIAEAARARGIPVRRLTDGSLLQLGYGAQQRRVWAAETDRTSAIGEAIAQDKELTKQMLSIVGVPVPEGRPVESAEEAWAAAQAVGLPVAVKPRKGNQGKGVSVGLRTREAVMGAYTIAAKYDRWEQVVVERHLEGADYRLLVVGGRLVAAARRDPPRVTGDGTSSIETLVATENLNPLRGDDHSTSLSKLRLDAIACEILAEQGLTKESVPALGQVVVLRRNANLSTGGSATDVTDIVHPLVARRAIEAARVVGLDIAGIDLVSPCVDRPLEESGGAFVEVNAAPGLRMHLEPSHGQGRAVGEAIIDSMFARGDDARIPIVAVTGTNGKTTTTRFVAHLMRQRGLRVGMTCTDGIYVEGKRIDTGDCSGPKSAKMVLGHPSVDVAVLETARGGMLREGLGFDWCDVAVVTNVGEGDHLGMNGIHRVEDLAAIKAIPVRRVSTRGVAVLNADDPLVAAMAPLCPGTVIFFSRHAESPVVVRHRASGGKAIVVSQGSVVLADGRLERRLASLSELPITQGGLVGFQIENLLAAVGAGWGLGLPLEALRFGAETFASHLGTVPGRFNVVTHRDSTVILDYGHNASALLALQEAISGMRHRRRKVVYTAAGDRRDEDIIRQAEILGGFFHEVYIYEDQCTRGRADGEVLRLMREGFVRAEGSPRIIQLTGELRAIGAAIGGLEPGDLLLCQVDQVELALEFVTGLFRQAESRSLSSLAQLAAAALAALGMMGG